MVTVDVKHGKICHNLWHNTIAQLLDTGLSISDWYNLDVFIFTMHIQANRNILHHTGRYSHNFAILTPRKLYSLPVRNQVVMHAQSASSNEFVINTYIPLWAKSKFNMLLAACIHTRHTWFTTNGGDNDDNYNIILCQPTMVAESVPQLNRRQQGLLSLQLSD